jgi:hypothetical protein
VLVIGAAVAVFALIPMIGIVAAIAIPSLLRARIAANEAGSIGDIRTMISAEATYQSASGGFYGTITCLSAPSGCVPGYSGPGFVDAAMAQPQATRHGYEFRWFETPSRARRGAIESFCYSAVPVGQGQTGNRSFGGDATGLIGVSPVGAQCCTDRGLDVTACPPLR